MPGQVLSMKSAELSFLLRVRPPLEDLLTKSDPGTLGFAVQERSQAGCHRALIL